MTLKLPKNQVCSLALFSCSGVILALSFIFTKLSLLTFVVLLPLIYLIASLQKGEQRKIRIIKSVWLSGFTFMLVVMLWFTRIKALDLLTDKMARYVFFPLTVFLIVGILSLGFLLVGWLITKLKIDFEKPSAYLLFPAIWVVGEAFRSIVFSVASLGDGGAIGLNWNFGVLGFAASATPLVFAGRIVGLFGLSFLVVVINIAIYNLIFGKLKKQALIAIGLTITIGLLGYLAYIKKPNIKNQAGFVHMQESEDKLHSSVIEDSIRNGTSGKAIAVFMPEYSYFMDFEYYIDSDRKIAKDMMSSDKGRIVTSQHGKEEEFKSNDIVAFDQDGNIINRQGKTFLIPAGEYIPYAYMPILVGAGNYKYVSMHQREKTIQQSKVPLKPIDINGSRYGALACSGVIAPEFYRDITKRGAEVLANMASLTPMGMDNQYFDQSLQMARFNAVANNRYFVQSARGRDSFIMDNNGKIIKRNDSQKTSYYTADVVPIKTRTIYTLLGEWVVYGSIIGLIAYSYVKRKELGLYEFRRSKKILRLSKVKKC